MHVYTTERGAVTAAHTPMPTTDDDAPVGELEFDRIVTRWSNPKIAGTPAWRLNGMIHQPNVASDLVRTAITTKTVEALRDPSKTLTRRYAHYLCSRVSIEKILNDQYGMAPTLVRQASKYETLRLKLRGGDGRGHRELTDEDIWDIAAREEADRQMAAYARGERKWMRWPPLHDGMSTNPAAHRRLKCGGLDQWRELTQAAALDGNRPHYNIDDGLQIGDMRVDVADEALGLVDGSGGIDRQWLADHHITSSMINELGDDRLLAMGLDPQELRAAAAALDASDATVACPVDASAPAGWRICRCRRWMRNTGVRPNAWMMWSTIPCCACGWWRATMGAPCNRMRCCPITGSRCGWPVPACAPNACPWTTKPWWMCGVRRAGSSMRWPVPVAPHPARPATWSSNGRSNGSVCRCAPRSCAG